MNTQFFTRPLALLLMLVLITLPVHASDTSYKPGDQMGWVLYTDIVTYINDKPIRSYNIGGYTYVVAEDLANYGFSVTWDANNADGILSISSGNGIVTSNYTPEPNTHRAGDPAMPYLFTKILTYICGQPVWAPNIGGLTCVGMDDLAYFFAENYVWDANTHSLRLTLRQNCASIVPDKWDFTYQTPNYNKDITVNGERATWVFTKTNTNSFVLASSSGTTNFTPQIMFGDDRMSYRIDFQKKLLGLAGNNYFTSAPHSITAHDTIHKTLYNQKLFWGTGYWDSLAPDYFRGYAMQNPDKAKELLKIAADATAVWRVYINDELIKGLPVTMPSSYYSGPGGRMETSQEYTYLYDHRINLNDVKTIRIELGS